MSEPTNSNRPLTKSEFDLCEWMLQHGHSDAHIYFDQLKLAAVTPWRCGCGCASLSFQIKGKEGAPPGVHVLSEFLFGEGQTLAGIFIYESHGILSGLEVYGLRGPAPTFLPEPHKLREWNDSKPPS